MTAETPRTQEFHLRDYLQILARRRWTILVCVLVTFLAAVISSLIATPLFRATCQLEVERQGVRILKQDFSSAESSWLDYQDFYNTQYKIMASDAVMRLAIDRLHLRDATPDDTAAAPSSLAQFKAKIMNLVRPARSPIDLKADPYRPLLKRYRGGLQVNPVRDSHLVDITYVHTDPVFAAEMANAVARAYIDFRLAARSDMARQSQEFFLKQTDDLRKELTTLQVDLNNYARAHGILSGDATDTSVKNLDDLRTAKTRLDADVEAKAARLKALRSASPESLSEVRSNPTVISLQNSLAEYDRAYRQLLQTYDEEYRDARETKAKLENTKSALAGQITAIARQTLESARTEYEQAVKEREGIDRLYAEASQRVGQFRTDVVVYLQKKDVVDQKQRTLTDLLQKQNEFAQAGSLGETAQNVRVVGEAVPAEGSFKPNKTLNAILGLLFGLFIGLAAAVLIEYIDNTLKSPEDVRNVLGVAVLGMIPAHSISKKKAKEAATASDAALDPALVAAHQPLSPVSEAYRELRTAVLLATAGHPPRDLCITSCQPSEGKTTTAINLAIALSQLGRRVLLVDTDLRRPRCHQVLRVPSTRGVSTFLTGLSDLQSLPQTTSIERLWLIPAGPIPPNPAELLDSDRFREFALALRAREDFDHVIFDSPPVLSVVDPLLIGRHTEGTVMVLKSGFTSRDAGRLGKEKLVAGRLTLLGVVLNAVQLEHVPYQYRYYRYGYAEENDDANRSEHNRGDRTVTSEV